MSDRVIKIGKITSLVIFLSIIYIGSINIAYQWGLIQNDQETSFPGYSAIYFVGIFYIIPLLISLFSFDFFSYKDKNRQPNNTKKALLHAVAFAFLCACIIFICALASLSIISTFK